MGLLAGSLTPSLHSKLVRLSSYVAFGIAVNLLQDFTQVSLSRETARRLTERAGSFYVEHQSEQVSQIEQELPAAGVAAARQVISLDGAMVPLRGGEWAEVKTLVVGSVAQVKNSKGIGVVKCQELSYFSRIAEAESFGRLALVV